MAISYPLIKTFVYIVYTGDFARKQGGFMKNDRISFAKTRWTIKNAAFTESIFHTNGYSLSEA